MKSFLLLINIFLVSIFLASKLCISRNVGKNYYQIDVKLSEKSLSKYLSLSHDPCKDFYNFSCEGWIYGKHLENIFGESEDLSDIQDFNSFLSEGVTKRKYDDQLKIIKTISDMYRKCLTMEVELQQICLIKILRFGYYAYASYYIHKLENNIKIKYSYKIVENIFKNVAHEFKLLLEERKDLFDKYTIKNYLNKINKLKINRRYHKYLGNLSFMEKCYNYFKFSHYDSPEKMMENIDNYQFAIPDNDKKFKKICVNYIVNLQIYEYDIDDLVSNVAHYHLSLNNIIINPIALKEPCFSPKFPMSLNYGCIGTIIGHEIIHAFDLLGMNYDIKGNINQNMTNKDSRKKYKDKSNCLSMQYTNESLKDFGSNRRKFLILNENIADNGGIKISHRAYMKYLESIGGSEPKIPGFETLTEEQLFFINFARFFCTLKRSYDNVGPHFPGNIRIKNTLSNYLPFSKAYNCKVGSKMNPINKCEVWL
ncbi:Phosphate-regulating neutral endopeptidase [Strongyloides ratti]|uniref:Phosphate-regulating neutral endopeptidase n=1 Tax=Strongyloides ratti TaxID=34506 RepID=A0A090KY28_STRRB|nr:Phosphate-regulating neutral endopeptidase [Strongyloides ratti]CEF62326.1 Phosphate-regulating neutral endopeptidase [Strongyloides ratti]